MNRRAIFSSDIRRLGGVVTVATGSAPADGQSIFRVAHVSRGGDVAFLSRPIIDEDQAAAAARVLAEFTGAAVETR